MLKYNYCCYARNFKFAVLQKVVEKKWIKMPDYSYLIAFLNRNKVVLMAERYA